MKRRILALVHDHLVPPRDTKGIDVREAEWKMEFDVIETLREIGHEVRVRGVHDDLRGIRATVASFSPHIVFNLLEAFAGVTTFDQNVVSYLELLRLPYTGCNPRGLILARDKALSKKLLAYHRVPVPDFTVVRRWAARPCCRASSGIPLIVKSLFFESSTGISQASVVENDEQLARRVTFIHEQPGDGRHRRAVHRRPRALRRRASATSGWKCLPVWEMSFAGMADNRWRIATERVKWSTRYQKTPRHHDRRRADLPDGTVRRASTASPSAPTARSISTATPASTSGSTTKAAPTCIDVNPNPNLAYGEDFAESAERAGTSYEKLLERIITLGLRWEPARTG